MLKFDKTYTEWTSERLLRHLLYWLAWLLFYGVVNSGYHDEGIGTWILIELVIMPTKLLYVYTVIYVLLPRFLWQKRYTAFFAWAISLGLIGGVIIRLIDFHVIAEYILDMPLYGDFYTTKIFYKNLDLIYIASLPTIIKLWQRQIHQEKQTQLLANQKLVAELQLLRNQLQPHFLFNTLNNLYGMVLSQEARAGEVVLRLSKMMSYMLYECNEEKIALHQEIAQLQNYIGLEQIRYGQRLDVSFETSGALEGQMIAPLLLIAFWENAFKHGPARNEQSAWISGNLWVANGVLHFHLENNTTDETAKTDDLLDKQTGGVGLTNVRKRLELIYPEKHELIIRQSDSYLVKLEIAL